MRINHNSEGVETVARVANPGGSGKLVRATPWGVEIYPSRAVLESIPRQFLLWFICLSAHFGVGGGSFGACTSDFVRG